MLLALDIGNTNTVFAVFDGNKLIKKWRHSTVRDKTSDELEVLLRQFFISSDIDSETISAVIASSVVPQQNSIFQKTIENYFKLEIIFVDGTFDLGLKIFYDSPQTLGADRIVDAFSAAEKYETPCIICDFGTAATIDAVSAKNEFLGGIIAPGITLLAETLFEKTSKLPKAEIKKPPSIFGNSTISSIQSGIFHGYIGLVEGVLQKMIAELGGKPRVIATGGFASLIAENSRLIEIVDETLLLDGLRLIYEKMKS